MDRERPLGGRQGPERHRPDHDRLGYPPVEGHDQHRRDHQRPGDHDADDPRGAAADQAVPGGDRGADQQCGDHEAAGEVGDRRVDRGHQRERPEGQRENRCRSRPGHGIIRIPWPP